MDGGNSSSLLDLARSAAIPPSPYHSNPSAGTSIASLVGSTTSSPQDSAAMRGSRLNGWSAGYNASDPATAVVSHHGSAGYPPYATSFAGAGAGATGVAMSTKPGYTSFATGSEFLTNAQCQQVQLNQLSPLNGLPQRNHFSFYGDMSYPNPGVGSGSFFSDLAGLPSIPRFDPDGASGYMTETNPGKVLPCVLCLCFVVPPEQCCC